MSASSCSTTTTVFPCCCKFAQRGDEPVVVARMEADRRFIEQIQHAHEPRTDASRQSHALPLAAAERVGRAIERQILGAHAIEKREPPHDLRHDRLGHGPLVVRKLNSLKKLERRRHRESRDLVDREPAQPAAARLRPQPRAVAIGTDGRPLYIGWLGSSRRRAPAAPRAGDWSPRRLDPSHPVAFCNYTQSVTCGARAIRAVETKRPRLDLADARPALRARITCIEQSLLPRSPSLPSPLVW